MAYHVEECTFKDGIFAERLQQQHEKYRNNGYGIENKFIIKIMISNSQFETASKYERHLNLLLGVQIF